MAPKPTEGWRLPMVMFVIAATMAAIGFLTELTTRADAAAIAGPSNATPHFTDPSIAGLSVAPDAKPDDVMTYY